LQSWYSPYFTFSHIAMEQPCAGVLSELRRDFLCFNLLSEGQGVPGHPEEFVSSHWFEQDHLNPEGYRIYAILKWWYPVMSIPTIVISIFLICLMTSSPMMSGSFYVHYRNFELELPDLPYGSLAVCRCLYTIIRLPQDHLE